MYIQKSHKPKNIMKKVNIGSQVTTGRLSASRREFLRKTGFYGIAAMFGVGFFTSCSSDDDTPAPINADDDSNDMEDMDGEAITITGDTITIDLNRQTSLQEEGAWLLIREAQLLVVNVNGSSYSALTSVCTHTGCDNSWGFDGEIFTCNCHGSRFNTSGDVLRGPATSPLAMFETSIQENILTVTK